MFVYKQRLGLLPQIYRNYYQSVTESNTRSMTNNDLYVEFARTTSGSKSIKIIGAKLQNTLPIDIKEANTVYQFKKEVKMFLSNTI